MKEPKAKPGTKEKVSVEWLMQNISYSIDGCNSRENFDPKKVIESKIKDLNIAPLWESILEAGWTTPICLFKETDFYDFPKRHEGKWKLGNGHHRFALAVLMCADEIPVFWDAEGDYMNSHVSEGKDLPWNPSLYEGMMPTYKELFLEQRAKPEPFEVVGWVDFDAASV